MLRRELKYVYLGEQSQSYSVLTTDQACAKGGGILSDQKAPPAAAARRISRRITVCPPRFLDFDTCLLWTFRRNTKVCLF